MKHLMIIACLSCSLLLFSCKNSNNSVQWKTGIQTYSFHKFTLMEALHKTQTLSLQYAEAYFFQPLGGQFTDSVYLNYDLDIATQQKLKDAFAQHNIRLYAFGVAMYETEAEWVRFFEFAKNMGCAVVTCEPKLEQLDFVEQLANKYQIEVAIHNHPDASVYAHPDVLVKALEGRSEMMGVCADPGHWKRMGHDPIESLRKLNGRIKVVHFKDLNQQMEDTVWGTGVLNVAGILAELKHQQFKGLLSVEYENFSDTQEADIRKSMEMLK